MASEITVSASLTYVNAAQSITSKSLTLQNVAFNITGKQYAEGMMSVATTSGGVAIPVSNLATLGWALFKNNDPTNYVELLTAVSGTKFAKIAPGEIALLRFPSSVTAPAAQANTAAINLEFLILEN